MAHYDAVFKGWVHFIGLLSYRAREANLHFQSHPLVGNDMGSFPLEGSDSGSFYFYLELGGLLNVQILHR
uniref:Uncharacterized protein n=1 Tax=Coxiella burnetii TaxID=777 RepID=Q06HF6_COXBE|nr:hypothetical protein [Coxiella burnetii]ABI95966.1 hypothetical protein [Coxiella burnetii]